jgi:DNA-directed RNA polymerase specialized sigma24 family protein
MDAFRRCVVILTLLEGTRANEAAELLGADVNTVKAVQARGGAEMTWRLAGILRPASERSFARKAVAFG